MSKIYLKTVITNFEIVYNLHNGLDKIIEITVMILKIKQIQLTTTLLLSLVVGETLLVSSLFPEIKPLSAIAQTNTTANFKDVSQDYWAAPFIKALVEREIVAGFPDNTFKPDEPVTRAQFAAMLTKAFQKQNMREKVDFNDVAADYWANQPIRRAYRMGFLSGYPNNVFQPNQNIPKEQVLVALANGLNYKATGKPEEVISYYSDEDKIADFAVSPIAAATEQNLVVNYPNLRNLNPKKNATRAEVAAMIYQALVSENTAGRISSTYVVSVTDAQVATTYTIPAGSILPMAYEKDKILVADDEIVNIVLKIASNVNSSTGEVLIPAGTEVVGKLTPTENGTQFVAESLTLKNGKTMSIEGTSSVVTATEVVKKGADTNEIIQQAAVSTAAAAAISTVTGDQNILSQNLLKNTSTQNIASLIQAYLGLNEAELLVIDPNTDLDIKLDKDLMVSVTKD